MGSRTPTPIDLTSYLGEPILISDVASPGQLVYTVVAQGAQWDEITVEAWHVDLGVAHTLTLVVTDTDGATTLAEKPLEFSTTENARMHIEGWRLRQPREIRFYADTADIFFVKVQWDLRQAPA